MYDVSSYTAIKVFNFNKKPFIIILLITVFMQSSADSIIEIPEMAFAARFCDVIVL